MVTFYCPHCWETVNLNQEKCPHCGYFLDDFKKLNFEEKLLTALHHTVLERRIMAAQILGIQGSQKAIPEFRKIIESGEMNYYFLRSILLSVAKIDHPDREEILKKASHHPSELVASLARNLLKDLAMNREPDTWDHHTS